MSLGKHKWPNKEFGIYVGPLYTECLSRRS